MAQEEGKVIVDRPRLQHVVVVQDQHELLRGGLELVDQGGHDALARDATRAAEEGKHALAHAADGTIERDDHVSPEPDRVVVPCIQRQPGDGPPRGCGPVSEQGGLAEAGGRAHKDHLPGHPLIEPLDQAWSGEVVWAALGDVDLGGEQAISFAGCGFVRGCNAGPGHRVILRVLDRSSRMTESSPRSNELDRTRLSPALWAGTATGRELPTVCRHSGHAPPG
jgi:hypothetical protein